MTAIAIGALSVALLYMAWQADKYRGALRSSVALASQLVSVLDEMRGDLAKQAEENRQLRRGILQVVRACPIVTGPRDAQEFVFEGGRVIKDGPDEKIINAVKGGVLWQ